MMTRLDVRLCSYPGCTRSVPVRDPVPLVTVTCPACAFWDLMLGDRGEVALLTRLQDRRESKFDFYYITPNDDPMMADAPVMTVRLGDGTEITTQRLRCIGVAPSLVTMTGRRIRLVPSQLVIISHTPNRPLGVTA